MKKLLKHLAYLTFLFFLLSCSDSKEEPKLNFLLITCEDISPLISVYGDSTAHTPNIDKLAAESIIYTNAFATVGVCAPARSSIITGMYPVSIGTHNMRTAADYNTWGNRKYREKAWGRDINGDTLGTYSAVIPPEIKCFTEFLRKEGYYCANNFKTDYQFAAPVTAWNANSKTAHWRNRERGQPFLAMFNDMSTHESRIWMHDTLPLTVAPSTVKVPAYLPDDSIVRKDLARVYSNIELMDKNVGKRIDELEKDSLLDKTVIIWFSDHGGPMPKGKREHTEDGLKVPFLVRLPYGENSGYEHDLISFVDIAPTILSLADIPVPEYMQGQAFLGSQKTGKPRQYIFGSGDRYDNIADRSRTVRDERFLFVKNYYPELPPYKDFGYRKNIPTMRHLLELKELDQLNEEQMYWFRSEKLPEELYDCEKDPHCLNNLIANANYTDKVLELSTALNNWVQEVNDLGVIPESELLEEMWPGREQPVTSNPEISYSKNEISLQCDTDGASIAYIISKEKLEPDLDSGWKLYSQPIKITDQDILYVLATRIGYKDSDIIELNCSEFMNKKN